VKERLTGAIILVVLIVLLVPELLSGPSRSAPVPQQAAATSAEEPPLRSYTIDLADDSHRGAGTSASTPQASGPAQPAPINESPTTQQTAPTATDSESTPAEESQSVPQTSPAAPSSQRDAVREEPQPAAPRKPTERPVTAKPAIAQRPVAADKFPAEERYTAAEKPANAPAAAGGTASMGGWMVQLGVFASRENADRLTQELKGKGFHTAVSESTGGGRKLWRVRAGPVPERAAADQLNAKLRAAGHAGSVVPKQGS
jgi:DedD protein